MTPEGRAAVEQSVARTRVGARPIDVRGGVSSGWREIEAALTEAEAQMARAVRNIRWTIILLVIAVILQGIAILGWASRP